ncbi:hypothetical protein [Hyphococcus sp.]|uniref:hypothetical protein n=1 Tax=Hyphococcus sp. TaxID=2038636 RepID=UPI003CCB8EB8
MTGIGTVKSGAANSAQHGLFFRSAIIFAALAASACATQPYAYEEWTALGYLSPAATGEPEIIGVYESKRECEDAGEAWMSRQVVGNPVSADCLPTDRN